MADLDTITPNASNNNLNHLFRPTLSSTTDQFLSDADIFKTVPLPPVFQPISQNEKEIRELEQVTNQIKNIIWDEDAPILSALKERQTEIRSLLEKEKGDDWKKSPEGIAFTQWSEKLDQIVTWEALYQRREELAERMSTALADNRKDAEMIVRQYDQKRGFWGALGDKFIDIGLGETLPAGSGGAIPMPNPREDLRLGGEDSLFLTPERLIDKSAEARIEQYPNLVRNAENVEQLKNLCDAFLSQFDKLQQHKAKVADELSARVGAAISAGHLIEWSTSLVAAMYTAPSLVSWIKGGAQGVAAAKNGVTAATQLRTIIGAPVAFNMAMNLPDRIWRYEDLKSFGGGIAKDAALGALVGIFFFGARASLTRPAELLGGKSAALLQNLASRKGIEISNKTLQSVATATSEGLNVTGSTIASIGSISVARQIYNDPEAMATEVLKNAATDIIFSVPIIITANASARSVSGTRTPAQTINPSPSPKQTPPSPSKSGPVGDLSLSQTKGSPALKPSHALSPPSAPANVNPSTSGGASGGSGGHATPGGGSKGLPSTEPVSRVVIEQIVDPKGRVIETKPQIAQAPNEPAAKAATRLESLRLEEVAKATEAAAAADPGSAVAKALNATIRARQTESAPTQAVDRPVPPLATVAVQGDRNSLDSSSVPAEEPTDKNITPNHNLDVLFPTLADSSSPDAKQETSTRQLEPEDYLSLEQLLLKEFLTKLKKDPQTKLNEILDDLALKEQQVFSKRGQELRKKQNVPEEIANRWRKDQEAYNQPLTTIYQAALLIEQLEAAGYSRDVTANLANSATSLQNLRQVLTQISGTLAEGPLDDARYNRIEELRDKVYDGFTKGKAEKIEALKSIKDALDNDRLSEIVAVCRSFDSFPKIPQSAVGQTYHAWCAFHVEVLLRQEFKKSPHTK